MAFVAMVAQSFAFFTNNKYAIKISGPIKIVELFKLHLSMYFVYFLNKR
jgi:hypothetical protein